MAEKRFHQQDYLNKTYQPQALGPKPVHEGENYQPVGKPANAVVRPAIPTGSGLAPIKPKG